MKRIGSYEAIADTGRTLLKLLRDRLTPYPVPHPELIGLSGPAERGDFNLTLFLYQIRENPEYRLQTGRPGGLPPLALDLCYLMTAHSTAEAQTRMLDEHRILGRAVQTFHENGILQGSMLEGTLAEHGESLRIVRESVPTDMLNTLFWQMPYRLSVAYQVGPVYVDPGGGTSVPRVL
ncbi:hypothetical protein J2T17_002633 [Paenibacillus mucilaginosus]|uniref:DUF4255 domain-containing protein n=1 Tax=Paenibacillus mucilaginosus TaxID=61624 RepID=UPI003D2127CA